jgi:recombinational DNA repair protein RecT
MAKKTVFRRASKWLPLSPEIQDAIRTDEDREFAQARNVTPTVRAEAINPFAPMLPAIEMEPAQEGGEA